MKSRQIVSLVLEQLDSGIGLLNRDIDECEASQVDYLTGRFDALCDLRDYINILQKRGRI